MTHSLVPSGSPLSVCFCVNTAVLNRGRRRLSFPCLIDCRAKQVLVPHLRVFAPASLCQYSHVLMYCKCVLLLCLCLHALHPGRLTVTTTGLNSRRRNAATFGDDQADRKTAKVTRMGLKVHLLKSEVWESAGMTGHPFQHSLQQDHYLPPPPNPPLSSQTAGSGLSICVAC